jgi:kinesin family protein C1
MLNRDDDDDSEQAERKGVQPFLISTNPSTSASVPGWMPSHLKKRTISLNVSQQRISRVSGPRAVSSPSHFRSVTPVIEEPADTDCDDICAVVGALTLGAAKADMRGSRIGRGMTSDYGTNPFLKPKIPQSQLPQPTPTPARQQQVDPSPHRPPSTTPRRSAQTPFLNRFTNDRCPDFYNERMEAMERDFRMFKEKMETDVRQATDYKESIQQLQSRGTFSTVLVDLSSSNMSKC